VVCSEDRGSPGDGDVLAGAARDDLAQDSVQPAGGLATEPGQLAVPPGPDPQDKSMIIGADLLADGRAERGRRRSSTSTPAMLAIAPQTNGRGRFANQHSATKMRNRFTLDQPTTEFGTRRRRRQIGMSIASERAGLAPTPALGCQRQTSFDP